MSTQLIAHLKKKCEADDNVKILLSQWEFDQKLVGKALENIGGFYPHFSNHNASHSQQILVNIERILGKDIELLSGTDTWLILEAAYWHDIGMLVDAKSAKEVHGNEDFKFMVKTIAQDKSHDLHAFCSAYKDDDWIAAIGSEEHPFDGVEKYRQLIAEWFRRNHDKRIGGLIEDPFKYLNITSPRTELLPKRIYRYLGLICMSHGMNFTDVMEKLPFKQTGLGTEDCHPRFIGCLLRLGDLFDLDDNRFCPVMAKHVSQQPSMSKAHEDKHLSLREFQLDRRTVKLVAECPGEMSYIETQNWFGWIREEFQNQMSQWNLIVPNQKFGSLPTIEQLDVRMEIKYEDGVKKEKILLNNKPMKFSLDEDNAIEILQGSNLYKDTASVFRELIQNAIDATSIRIGIEFEERLRFLTPECEEFKEIVSKYPIDVNFYEENSKWYLSIKDHGIGFNTQDLKYIQKIAGSRKNKDKLKNISKLPQWLKPSSYFGIGLQSAFLLSSNDQNKITFESKSFITNDVLQVEMYSPISVESGYCFISKLDDSFISVGTTLRVELDLDRLSQTFFVEENYLKTVGFIQNKKDVRNKLVFLEIIKDIRAVFNSSSWFLINFDKILENELIDILSEDPYQKNFRADYVYWNTKLNIKLTITRKVNFEEFSYCDFYFKGQKASTKGWSFRFPLVSFYSFCIDFYGYEARECLNVSRDYWRKSFIDKFNNEILNEILEDIVNKTNGFEFIFDEFYYLVKLYFNRDIAQIEKVEFSTSSGYKKINEIKMFQSIYLSGNYFKQHDFAPSYFNSDLIVGVSEREIINFLMDSMSGFVCHKVEGLNFFSFRDSISIVFTKKEINISEERIKVYPVRNLESSLKTFLESNVIYMAEQRRSDGSFQDVDFPIKICCKLLDSKYEAISENGFVFLPIYYTVKEIHIIPFEEYLTLFSIGILNKVKIEDYKELVADIFDIIKNNSNLLVKFH